MCELDPLWPIIAVGLSGLALLATMLLIQRLMTLEIRAEVDRDLNDIDVLHDSTAWSSRQRLLGDPLECLAAGIAKIDDALVGGAVAGS